VSDGWRILCVICLSVVSATAAILLSLTLPLERHTKEINADGQMQACEQANQPTANHKSQA